MKDWGEATTTVGIISQIVNEGGRVEFDNRDGVPRVRVSRGSVLGLRGKSIMGMSEPEIVRAIWSAWEEVR